MKERKKTIRKRLNEKQGQNITNMKNKRRGGKKQPEPNTITKKMKKTKRIFFLN